VITVHDMIYELFDSDLPDRGATIAAKKAAILEAEAIISISENTKRDIVKFYPSVEEKIHVIHHGVSMPDPRDVKPFGHRRPFILFVGDRGWYKNFDLLLDVYVSEKGIHEDFDLVCFGGGEPAKKHSDELQKAGLTKNVYFLQGNDDLLNALYASARAFVYLSRYEGFGMPILEAMSLGCPVLCSDNSSMPEVAGNAASVTDPENKNAVVKALRELLFDETLRTRLTSAGTDRARLFSWDKCAANTYEVYQKVLKS
jgi:glycosyltransferase involved in cell wall biosynthesis